VYQIRTGVAARIFQSIADADINIDMIVQNVSAAATGLTDISFTLPKTEGQNATNILQKLQGEIGFQSIQYDDQIGKLSLIGAGMRSHPGVTATFFACMSEAGVNIEMISTSEIRISIVCRATDLEKAVKAAHTAFESRCRWRSSCIRRNRSMSKNKKLPSLAVVGATGAVGTVMLDILSQAQECLRRNSSNCICTFCRQEVDVPW
jgi:predicted amino acid-binding ACT domain protein